MPIPWKKMPICYEFFAYLKDIGVWDVQHLLSTSTFNAKNYWTESKCWTDQAAMKLVGFNAYQIKNGVCKRGEYKRTNPDREPVNRGLCFRKPYRTTWLNQ